MINKPGNSQKNRDYIDGWYGYCSFVEEGSFTVKDEKTWLSDKPDRYKKGWKDAKNAKREKTGK